jgi:hypothetical protein
MCFYFTRDRFRTPNNLLGDCYAVAVVEHLSQKELNEDLVSEKSIWFFLFSEFGCVRLHFACNMI